MDDAVELSNTLDPTPSPLRIALQAIRPKTLSAGVAPVLIATAMAYGDGVARLLPALLALCCALSVQITSNLCNDVADFLKGADTATRRGPTRVTQAGWLRPQTMVWATIASALMSALFFAGLCFYGGWSIILVAVLSILSALLYTAGPFPLGYHGLGDLFVWSCR